MWLHAAKSRRKMKNLKTSFSLNGSTSTKTQSVQQISKRSLKTLFPVKHPVETTKSLFTSFNESKLHLLKWIQLICAPFNNF